LPFKVENQAMNKRISPLDIPLQGKKIEFELQESDLPRLKEEATPHLVLCRANLKAVGDQVSMEASYQASLSKTCDCCLKQTKLELHGEFRLTLLPQYLQQREQPGEGEITAEMADIDYYDGKEINLGPYFEDQIFLDLPFRIECSDDCQGICPQCGKDLNKSSCECEEPSVTRPFANLQNLIQTTQEK